MKSLKLASMLVVAGGLAMATSACSGGKESGKQPAEAVATPDAAACAAKPCAAAGCAAKPCAAAGCAAKPCAAAGCGAKPCAAKP